MNKIAEKNDALDAFIANYCIDHPLSGSVRITLNDKIIYQKFCGKADYENDRELDEKSVFSLYSLSKPFCAIGLMKLFDKGLVDIDTHHGEYLPEMCGFDKRVTVRQMLCHTSGLPDFVQTEGFTDKHPDGSYDKLKEALLQLSCYPMLFEPGTAERYENINFLPLALIIENVSGMSYSEYMEQEVFSPLGMSTAKVDFPGLIVSLRVKGYELINGVRMHVDRCTDYMLGAGDIIGTLDDVYCLNKAIKNKALLKPETWIQVLTPSPLNNMGFGCTVAEWHGMNRIMHNGGYTGFRSLHLQLPDDDFDIIFLFNTGYCDARYDISEKIYDIYYGGMIPDTVKVEMDKGYI